MLKSPTPACFLLPTPLHPSSNLCFNLSFPTQNSHFRPLTIRKTLNPLFSSSSKSSFQDHDEEEEEYVIGDCLVFEEGAFDDPYLESDSNSGIRRRREPPAATPENLVPEKWKEVQAEINMTKKEKRAIAKQLELGSRVEKRTGTGLPPVKIDAEAYRSMMLAKLKPVVLEQPSFPATTTTTTSNPNKDVWTRESSVRVAPKDPRLAVVGSSLKDVEEFFNSGEYQPEGNKGQNSQGRRQLFTAEEKILLNKKLPNLADATSRKWLPLHTLAASGEFYLMSKLLNHIDDINALDKDGLTALHKAILGRKVAITNFLLRESANPFVRDKEGATLLHYAVQAACSPAIKILLLYNVDINLSDDDGWTPLHLAVQTKRTDMVRILLIKGADKTLKNKDGLTPLDLCLHLGQDVRTYQLIKLLKELPKSKYSL